MNERSLQHGDLIVFIDRKQREYCARLDTKGELDIRGGRIELGQVAGREEGAIIEAETTGERFIVFRQTLGEYVLNMPRGAQIMYPKDIGHVLVWGNIRPGIRVLEAGLGSGALTISLLQAVGEQGQVVAYELREDFMRRGLANVTQWFGRQPENLQVINADIYEGIAHGPFDRIVLDLPEPWQVMPHATDVLVPGGIFISYLPTIPQVETTVLALLDSRRFADPETVELLLRTWKVDHKSVRPDHRMIAHTGFLIFSRKKK